MLSQQYPPNRNPLSMVPKRFYDLGITDPLRPFCSFHNLSSLNNSLLEISWDPQRNFKPAPSPTFYTFTSTLSSELLVGHVQEAEELWCHLYTLPSLDRFFVHHSISNTKSAGTFNTFVKLTSSSPTYLWRNRTTPQTNKNKSPVYSVRVRSSVFLLP